MINRLFSPIVLLMCCFTTMAQAKQMSNYQNDTFGYSFDYPSGWEIEENLESGTTTLYVPLAKGETIYKQLQISVAQWEEGTLQEFVDVSFAEGVWRKLYPDFTISDLGETENSEENTRSFEMHYSIDDRKVVMLCYLKQNYDRVYIILAASPQDEYNTYKEQFMGVINSLNIW